MRVPCFNYIYSLFRVIDPRPQLLSFWCLPVEFKRQLAFFHISSTGPGDVVGQKKKNDSLGEREFRGNKGNTLLP